VTDNAYERLISDSAVWVDEAWLPPGEDCEELADLKVEHVRLVSETRLALTALGVARRAAIQVTEARDEGMTAAVLAGRDPASVDADEPDAEAVAGAECRYLATAAALERFVQEAREEIIDREPEIRELLAEDLIEAEELRKQARQMLAEADELAARPEKMGHWLDRFTVRPYLGPLAYEDMPAPHIGPMPGSAELVLAEGQVAAVGSDGLTVEERNAQILSMADAEDAIA
jgi:hypothetical protein